MPMDVATWEWSPRVPRSPDFLNRKKNLDIYVKSFFFFLVLETNSNILKHSINQVNISLRYMQPESSWFTIFVLLSAVEKYLLILYDASGV